MIKLSLEEEAAKMICDIQEKMVRKIFFRRWMVAVDVVIKYKPKLFNNVTPQDPLQSPTQNQIAQIQETPDLQQAQKKSKGLKNSNLKYGDIIYFKCYQQNENDINYKGVISGDGIASNILECIRSHKESEKVEKIYQQKSKTIITKHSSLLFQKCLFQVVNAKQYYIQNKLDQLTKDEDNQDNTFSKEKLKQRQLYEDEIKKKVIEEQAENQSQYQRLYGQNVLFEDDIQLIHLYSNCTLTLNHSVLAKQPCCRELSLEEESNDRSNFSFHSLNQAKKQGEPILYNDQIIMVNTLLPQWKLSVQDVNDMDANTLDGLEVNASEKFIPLKISCYIDCKNQKENQNLKGRFVQSGDLITIKNRHSSGFLAVKYKKLFSQFLERRNIDFIDPESNIRKQMKQDNFEIEKLLQQDSIKSIYEMYVEEDSQSEQSMNCFWEIQIKNPLQFQFPTYQSTFLLKHVYTGCYLMINNSEIQLTHDGTSSQCLFYLKSKKDLNDSIFYSESVQIQSVCNTNLILMCDKENSKNPVKLTEKQKKADISKTVFVLSPGDSELTKTAQRIFSLNLYLFQFYIFLQDWGMIESQYKSMEYDFITCFNTQKNLYDEIRQLYQTMENLQDYLTPKGSGYNNYDLQFRQNIVRESGIINMLLCILMLIHFMLYGSPQNRQKYYEIPGEKKKLKDNNIFAIPEKSAQKIAKQKLNPIVNQNKLATSRKTQKNCIDEIYKILLLCIQENQKSCHYLLKLNVTEDEQKRGTNEDTKVINFLLHQLPYYRISVSNILKESVRYTNQSFDLDQSSTNSWLKQLQSVNDSNIEDQCLFIEIMSLLMNDHFDNPIPQCQNIIRRKIFKKTIQKAPIPSIFDRAFQKFFINDQGQPCVSFQTQSQEDFDSGNNDFILVYKKFKEQKKIVGNKKGQYLIDFINLPTMRNYIRAEERKQKLPLMAFYETYTLNVLDFYCKLCRGRNYKSIKVIKKNCMSDQFLLRTIQGLSEHQLRYESLLITLYSIISIDSDPLQSIRIFQNKCYIEDDIKTFDMTGPSGKIFFQNSINENMTQQDFYKEFVKQKQNGMEGNSPDHVQELKNNNDLKEHESMKEFASYIIFREQNNGIVQKYINFLTQEEQNYPVHLKVKVENNKRADKNYQLNYGLYADFQLEYVLSILKLINTSINLGYNDLETNKKILWVLPNIFYALIITQNQNREISIELQKDTDFDQKILDIKNLINRDNYIRNHEGQYSRNWLMEFFILNTCLSNNKLLILKIYMESIDILATLFQLKKNLQLIKYIGFCKGNENLQNNMKFQNKKFKPAQASSSEIIQYSLDYEKEELVKQEQGKEIDFDDVDNEQYCKFLDIFDEDKQMVNLNSLLFKVLYSIKEKSKMNEDLLKIIMGGFDYYSALCEQVETIELISNKLELELFTIISGNNKKYPQIKGPNELEIEVKRMSKIIQQVKVKNKDAFKKIYDYVSTIILVYQTKVKDKPYYLQPFQKIIKNAGIHELLIQTILDPKKVKQKFTDQNDIVSYYNLLITFMEIFSRDNLQNQRYLFKNIHLILDIPLISQSSDKNGGFNKNINITKLAINISSQERVQFDVVQELVDLLIYKIEDCMDGLGNFFNQTTDPIVTSPRDVINIQNIIIEQKDNIPQISTRHKKLTQGKDIILIQAIIQYLKILKSLTRKNSKPSNPIIQNKHLILQNMLKKDQLKFMILPGNFLSDFKQLHELSKRNPIILEYKMKLHAAAINLLTECCHNYRLGIQEIQRTVLYDEIKHNMLHPYCYYIIKRSYLMFLFEVYINRVVELNQSNEVIDNDEISDILSRIIIPDIDQKQIFRYLEGLISNGDQNKELKNSIKVKKNQYFDKNKDIRQQGEQQFDRSPNIITDDNEFWKYIRKNGLIYFLVCVYDEIKDRVDLGNSEEQSLADEFSIIKNNIQKLKEIFKILEQDFRMKQDQLNLEEYRDLILSIEEIIPQRKITKFGTNYSIGFAPKSKLQFEKFDTLNDDLGGEKKIQEQENVQVINNKFKLNMKIYMLRSKIQIDDLIKYCELEKPLERKIDDIIPIVNYFKQYISKDDLFILEKDEMTKIILDRQINKKEQNVDKWEIFKIALRMLFQRKKFVKSIEDSNIDDSNPKDELSDQNEMSQYYKKFQLYLNRLAQIYRLKHQQRIETKEDELEDEQLGNKKQKSISQQIQMIRNETEINKQIQDDFSVEILMSQLMDENKFQPNKDFTDFLKNCINMFMGREIYIIKMCRIKLERQKPTDDEIQELGEENLKSENTQQRYNEFKLYQTCIAEADMDLIALKMMSQPISHKLYESRIEAITFLIQLMKFGNSDVQKRVLIHLQTNINLQNSFFQFLKIQLTQGVFENIVEVSEQYKEEYKNQQTHQETQFEILSLRILEFLQGLCENVNEEIQQFLTRQSLDDAYISNINVIRYVCDFLSIYLADNVLDFQQKNKMINQSLLTLIEFTTGYQDSIENVCSNKRLFSLMNSKILLELLQKSSYDINYFSPCQDKKIWDHPDYQMKYQIFQTLDSFIQILLAMIKKSKNRLNIDNLLISFDLHSLLCISEQIYNNRIKPKINGIVLDTKCTQIALHHKCTDGFCIIDNIKYVNDEDNLLIETGFNIFILFNYLMYFQYFPNVKIRKLFEFDQNKEDDEFDLDDNLKEKQLKTQREQDLKKYEKLKKKGQVQPIRWPTKIQQVLDEDDQEFKKQNQKDISEIGEQLLDQGNEFFHKRTMEFFQFYKEFLGRVEIQRKDGNLEKVFYQKPFFSRFITSQIKQHLIQKSNRNSDEERLYSLLENTNFYQNQMTHNQFMTRYKILDIGAKNWRTLKDISFCLCVFLTFTLIVYYDSIYTNQEPNQNILNIFSVVSYVQLALSIMICIFSSIERYPISITKSFDTGTRRLMILKNEAGFKSNDLSKLYNSFRIDKLDKKKVTIKLLLMSIDQDNLYNVIYLIITIFANQQPVLYAYLLLDIVYRSEDLQNIIRSITSNLGNLLKFCVLGLIGLLLFGTIGYDKFKDYYDESSGAYTSEFRYTIYTTINMGLRSGGGIGDVMNPINPTSNENYWGEYFFELCFFILFNILFIQIVFGIILDTFGELRDERQALLAEIVDKCFVCSLKRNDIDSKGEHGWYYHIYLEHNVYHMLYYITYLKNKNLNYCDSLEKYVKSLIQIKDTRFFPNGKCLQLPEFIQENTENSNEE